MTTDGMTMKTLSLLFFLLTIVQSQNVFGTSCDETTIEPIRSYRDGITVAKIEHRPLLCFITQRNCPPCRVAKQTLETMRLKRELGDCVLVEMDVAEPEASAMIGNRRFTPQLFLLDTRFNVESVDIFSAQSIDTGKICALLDQLPIMPNDPITAANWSVSPTSFEASPSTGPPPRIIRYTIATQYRNGVYQGTFLWGDVDRCLNVLGRYWNIQFVRANSGTLSIVQANYQIPTPGAFAWTRGNTIYISPVANYGKVPGICGKVLVHEFGHAAYGGTSHNTDPRGIMSPNAGTSGNFIASDYKWYGAYQWKSDLRPESEPNYLREFFAGSAGIRKERFSDWLLRANNDNWGARTTKQLLQIDNSLHSAP